MDHFYEELVVLLVTCLSDNCSLDNAIKIGAIEFLLKFAIYYIHERVWQGILINKAVTQAQTLKMRMIMTLLRVTTMTIAPLFLQPQVRLIAEERPSMNLRMRI